MVSRDLEKKAFWVVMFSSFLIFFAQTKSFHLLFDGLTYSALAKNILKTGDWRVLHLGEEQYVDFFQHPPLAIWMQAVVYHYFGWSESITRFLPGVFALGTVAVVFWITRLRFTLTAGFWAAFALMTSTRYIKWATNFYLDGPMTFFCVAGLALWLFSLEGLGLRRRGAAYLAGLMMGFAFMVKGVAAMMTLAVCFVMPVFYFGSGTASLFMFFVFGLVSPIIPWCEWGGGREYLAEYFRVSVAGRVQGHHLVSHPWRNIYLIWWPWWPISVLGAYAGLRACFSTPRLGRSLAVFLIAALSIPLAYTFGSGYLEHYITPFYPFASVLVGYQIAAWSGGLSERFLNRMGLGAGMIALVLATIAPDVNQMKEAPGEIWVRELSKIPSPGRERIQRIVFTRKSADLWLNLSKILAKTDWQAIGDFSLDRPSLSGSVLVSAFDESPNLESWVELKCVVLPEYRFYGPKGESFCP
jgi:4-amino-4-deoxy-L-arabinose transferase-like glycosyltransferase